MFENQEKEFKQEYSDTLLKEIVAFLNTNSGTIFVGFDDDGAIKGLKNAKDLEVSISNKIKTMICPDPSAFVMINRESLEDKEYIVIQVSKGVDIYYLASLGILKGVYTRVGSCSIPASQETVEQLIIKNKYLTFESSVSINQDLTFLYAKAIFAKEGIDIENDAVQKNLYLQDKNGKYTNLAKLLSDQNPYGIRLAVYPDETKANFIDIKEFSGSLLEVYDKTLDYLKLNSSKYGIVSKTEREDIEEYPEFILREILLNGLIHRNYEELTVNTINIYQNMKIEFLNYGSLYGISIEDALSGLSISRNPHLQALFMRIKRVDALGSGLQRVNAYYKERGLTFDVDALPSSFKVTLPRITVQDDCVKKIIVNYLKENKTATRKELGLIINKEKTTLINILNGLVDSKIIDKCGNGPATYYKLH